MRSVLYGPLILPRYTSFTVHLDEKKNYLLEHNEEKIIFRYLELSQKKQ